MPRPNLEENLCTRQYAAGAVYLGAVERVYPPTFGPQLTEARLFVETLHLSPLELLQGTILLIGSSMMSDAPAAFSSGIRRLTDSLPTTVSTA